MSNLAKKEIKAFQKEILDWYGVNRRELPWREGRDPYQILVSEIMSQQTQISRVIPKFEAWILAFPTVSDLAKASTADVLKHWSGLGYNRRALYLQKCAKTIVEKFGGVFPKEKDVLQTLPGIGGYTAAAVACFAFDQQIVVIDTNIRKIIILLCSGRLSFSAKNQELRIMNQERGEIKTHNSSFMIHDSMPLKSELSEKEILDVANELLPAGRASEWNQALMDYASAMLKKEKIVIPKQSKFRGSNRFYRGQIIKLLIAQKKIQIIELAKLLKIPEEKCHEIIIGLEKDALIIRENDTIRI